jgi:DNA repair exonuclease SbcCD ATPase subunit
MLGAIEPQTRRPGTRTTRSVLVLEPANGRLPVEPVLLTPGDYVIGSASSCSVVLPFQGVQPKHCEIQVRDRVVTVRSFDRRTWLNNGPFTETRLHKGDRLVIGPVEFRVGEMTTQEEPVASPPAPAVVPVRAKEPPRAEWSRVAEPTRRELAAETLVSAEARIDEAAALIERLMNEDGGPAETAERAPSVNAQAVERRLGLLEDLLASVQDEADEVRQRAEHVTAKDRSIAERERRISQIEAEILERMRHCDTWEVQLQTRSNELRATQTDSESSRRLLEERWSELDQQKRALEAETLEVEKSRTAAISAEDQLRHLEDQLVAREEQIYQTCERLSDSEQELEARRAEADAFEAECVARSQELAAMSKDLGSRSSDLEKRSAALDELARTHQTQQSELDARRAALDAEWKVIDERLAGQSTRLDSVAAAQQDLDVSRAVLEEAWATLEADRKALADRTRTLDSREREANCVEGRLHLDKERLAEERSRLESLRSEPATASDADIHRMTADESRLQDELRRLESDRSALDAARAEIERARASQQSARNELSERESRCRDDQKQIESARLELQKKSEAFAAERSAFRMAEEEVAAERHRLAEVRQNLEHEKAALESSQHTLSHAQLENAAWFEQHTAELAELERRRQELSEREAGIAVQAADLARRTSALAENDQKLSERAATLEADEAQLANARQSLARREVESLAEIAAQKTSAESLRAELAECEASFATERAEIDSTRQRLEQTRSELDAAQSELAEAQSQLEIGRTDLLMARQKLEDETGWLREDQKHVETVHSEIAEDRRTLLKEREELEALRSRLEAAAAAPVVASAPSSFEDVHSAFVAPAFAPPAWPEAGHTAAHEAFADSSLIQQPEPTNIADDVPHSCDVSAENLPSVESTPFASPAFEVPDFQSTSRQVFQPAFPSPFAEPSPLESPFRLPFKNSEAEPTTGAGDRTESVEGSSTGFSTAGAFDVPAASPFGSEGLDSPFGSSRKTEGDRIEDGFAQAAFDFRPELPAASEADVDDLPRMPRVVSEESSGFRLPRALDEEAGFRRPSHVDRGWGGADASRNFARRPAEDVADDQSLVTPSHPDSDVDSPVPSMPEGRDGPVEAEDSAKGGGDHRVQELRSQLAALFDLKKNTAAAASDAEDETAPAHEEPEVDDRGIDIKGLLGSLRDRSAEATEPELEVAERVPEPEPPKAPQRAVVVNDIDDSASVDAYMQQLFARNRRSGGESVPEPPPPPKSRVPAPEPERPRAVESFVVEAPSAEALETAKAGLAEPAAPAHVPEPLHKPNRDAIRASIHSLRQVANLNARTALAKHSGQQARSTLQLKATLAFVAVGLATILLVPGLLGSMGLRAYGWALVGVGLVASAEILMTMRRIRKARSSQGADGASADSTSAVPADSVPTTVPHEETTT